MRNFDRYNQQVTFVISTHLTLDCGRQKYFLHDFDGGEHPLTPPPDIFGTSYLRFSRYNKVFRSCNANVLLTFDPNTNRQTNYFFSYDPPFSRGNNDIYRLFSPVLNYSPKNFFTRPSPVKNHPRPPEDRIHSVIIVPVPNRP